MFNHLDHLSCGRCGGSFRPSIRPVCPTCPDGGALSFVYALGRVSLELAQLARREPWLWRFKELLPFDEALEVPPLQIGMTPLYGSTRLAHYAGVAGVILKDESRNPTGRVGDRAAALLVAHAQDRALPLVTRSLARPIASFAAAAGVPSLGVLGPSDDVAGVAGWGMRVIQGYACSQADLVRLAAESGALLGDAPNPLVAEGLKTVGLEIGEQLAERLPDWVAVDGAESGLAEAVGRGLVQLKALGLIPQLPRLLVANALAAPGDQPDVPERAVVDVTAAEARDASRQIRLALGLPIDADGAVALGAVRAARRAGVIKQTQVAVVVAQGGAEPFGPLEAQGASAPPELVTSFADLLRAAQRPFPPG